MMQKDLVHKKTAPPKIVSNFWGAVQRAVLFYIWGYRTKSVAILVPKIAKKESTIMQITPNNNITPSRNIT